ncbi:MAG: ATP-binding protein, partial [Planctomycetaceae bacterium]|nr:ATP-binding protein [Planctomycetaceae bacterium]
GIPAIAIDPKGDLGNLLLSFPELRPGDFRPWIDPGEATRAGRTVDQYAGDVAARWKKGLADWGQDGERIACYREAVDMAIYTPGSSAGLPLTPLRSLAAPPAAIMNDTDALRQQITSAVSGLLTLLGLDADPIRSREHILISRLLETAWKQGQSPDMADLIRLIQSPPFDRIGFLDLETMFPAAERFKLAMQLNNLLASPGFAGWMEGEPLDIQRLLYTPAGKPRLSIISIAHLTDSERMFLVTILLSEVLSWARAQPGTSSLRAILYMDEVAGYFPPVANPPSKPPMLTLLKQARAYGLGCVLATQNPVDLDYKGLSNAGTWFIGRLQTERDKARVLEGLEGASATAGSRFDRSRMEATLAGLGSRVFLMNNVHDDEPDVFHTRWAMSYLRGPLTRDQIHSLMEDRKAAPPEADGLAGAAAEISAVSAATEAGGGSQERPLIPPGIEECFLSVTVHSPDAQRLVYRPAVLGRARLHYVSAREKVDEWQPLGLLTQLHGDVPADIWADAVTVSGDERLVQDEAEERAAFGKLPTELLRPASYSGWTTDLKNHLYRSRRLSLLKCHTLKLTAESGEEERDFRARIAQSAREYRDLQLEKLRKSYTPKLARLEERIRKAEQRVEKESSQVRNQMMQAAISFGTSILGAMFGRKLASSANVGRAASSMRAAGRASREREDVRQAEENVEAVQAEYQKLEQEFKQATTALQESTQPGTLELTSVEVRPRKSDITIEAVCLAWAPWWIDSLGIATAAFRTVEDS